MVIGAYGGKLRKRTTSGKSYNIPANPDIIERLNDPEMCMDVVDDAITEIERLRGEVSLLRRILKPLKDTRLFNKVRQTPEESAIWQEL